MRLLRFLEDRSKAIFEKVSENLGLNATSEIDAESSVAIEKARICLSPNLMKCADFGMSCM